LESFNLGCSSFLAISNSIPKVEARLDTTHLNLEFREVNNANYDNDALIVDF
jgi:hypothetical protein